MATVYNQESGVLSCRGDELQMQLSALGAVPLRMDVGGQGRWARSEERRAKGGERRLLERSGLEGRVISRGKSGLGTLS